MGKDTTSMYKKRQVKIPQASGSQGWDIAIEQAQRGIAEANDRIARLNRSIDVFRECKERGEPWPGTVEPGAVSRKWNPPFASRVIEANGGYWKVLNQHF